MRAWVLNLDADLELGTAGAYTPSVAVQAQMARARPRARHVMGPDDVEVEAGQEPRPETSGLEGRAWCMTPGARATLIAAGAVPCHSPPVQVLRAVNSRGFCAALGQSLPGARFARDVAEVERVTASAAPHGSWLLKRAHAMAGKGQRRVEAGGLGARDRAWVERSLRVAGLQVEPWVDILLELTVHGWLEEDGRLLVGEPRIQECDETGAWRGSRPASRLELTQEHRQALRGEARTVGRALYAEGYFGPVGIDAFLWRGARGRVTLNPRGEINARYVMGWSLGSERPAPAD